VQGWCSGQEQYLARAREIAALGCVCLTFEPRGVARGDPEHETVTREENLRDILAAYDLLAGQRAVDASAIGVVGSSYGGYLAAVLSSLRPVKWLALRVPALYKDEDWAPTTACPKSPGSRPIPHSWSTGLRRWCWVPGRVAARRRRTYGCGLRRGG